MTRADRALRLSAWRWMPIAWAAAGWCLPACFPRADDLTASLPGVTEGDGAGVDAAVEAGDLDGTRQEAAPPLPDAAAPHDGVVIPDVAGVSCADFAAVWCAKARECTPRFVEGFFGAPEACPTRMLLWCAGTLTDPPETAWNAASFGGCIRGMIALPCQDWRLTSDFLKGPQCVVSGRRALGAGCASSAQCQSTLCRKFGSCGVCKERSLKDGVCNADPECAPGYFCRNGKCKAPGAEGAPCDLDDNPCHPTYRCAGGRCMRLGALGAPCTEHAHCDSESYLLCGSSRCSRAVGAQRWGSLPDGTVNYCAGGALAAAANVCIPRAKEGETCVVVGDGPRCAFPATCDSAAGVATGKCALPVLAACPAVRPPPPPEGYQPGQDPWCPTVEFPLFCPETDQSRSPLCLTPLAACSTVINCNGFLGICRATEAFDCQLRACRPGCAALPAVPAPSACDRCTASKCCGVRANCDADPVCRDMKTGPGANALQMCQKTFCSMECP